MGRTAALTRYGTAASLARLADETVGVALVLLVLDRTGNTTLAGAVVAGYTLPAIITGPLTGAWLTRLRRPTHALVVNELALAAVAGALLGTTGHVPGFVLVALAALGGITIPFTTGGFSSLVPRIAGSADPAALTRANTIDAVTFNVSSIAGPALAGTLAATVGPAASVAAVAVAGLIAAIATAALPAGVVPVPAVDARPGSLVAVARAGLRHLASTPPLRAATVTSALSLGAVALLVVAMPARAVELGAPRGAAGYLWAAIEVGCALSTVFVSPRLRGIPPERVVFCSVALYGLALACWQTVHTLPATVGLAVLAGFVEGPTLVSVLAARQRYSPAPLLAQVATTGASLKIGSFAIGSALSGVLTVGLGPSGTLLVAAGGQLLAAGAGVLAGLGRTRNAPAEPTAPAPSDVVGGG